jgi:type III secretory pathway component EscT
VPGIIESVATAFAANGVDLAALGLAWARALPAVAIVPAFGLRALPLPARAAIALALAASIFPALAPEAARSSEPWVLQAIAQLVRGLPIAIAAAVPLWAATMAGGVADALRDARDTASIPVVESRASPLGVPFALLASAIFLKTGGPARVAMALATRELGAHPIVSAVHDLVGGIGIAVAIGAPLLAAAVVIEIAAALVARAASPAHVHVLLAPLRALGVIAVAAIVLDRVAAAMGEAIGRAP